MIKVVEKEFLNDNFINKSFINNIELNDKLYFSKDNIYYFGNYTNDKLPLIKKKLLKNKKRIIRAIENGIKFIVCGNSYELFNNNFKNDNLNIYTSYHDYTFKKRFKKLSIKTIKNKPMLKIVNSLNNTIEYSNFKYKNLICVSNEKLIDKILKKSLI